MGVPKFFRYISERYPCLSELAREHSIPEFDNLYLDMNGIIHNCSHPDDNNIHFHLEEAQIFQDIFNYVDKLFYLIKPQKLFFLAVDGVAPRAKMNQQRSRRFRSAREAEVLESKALQRGEKREHERFDSNCITPGTEFMARLQEALRSFLRHKISTDPLWRNCRVILSGQETPGEGEHKIMDYIRFLKAQPTFDPNTRHCLYGLDADLIILGLCTHELHFVVLREEVKFGRNVKRTSVEETRFFLLHLGLLREYLELEFDQLSTPEKKLDVAQLIDDWVLMGFMVGNDFIPHLPCLHISSNALPLLYKTYIRIYPQLGGNINEYGKLNLKRLQIFMAALTEVELELFEEQFDNLKYMAGKTEAFDVDVSEIQNSSVDDDLVALIDNSSRMYDDGQEDLSDDESGLAQTFANYKMNYYRNKFKREMHSDSVADLGQHYVTALQWILDYYYRGVQSWDWYYPFHYAPFISDLKNIENMNINFQLGKPFLPFQQLLAVLPAASSKLLPAAYHDLMLQPTSPLAAFYPTEFESDLNGKKHDWEAVVLIPFIDETLLLSSMLMCEPGLTSSERERNKHGPMYQYDYTEESQGPLLAKPPLKSLQHTYCTEVAKWAKEIALDLPHSVCVELPNASRHVFFPGFPTTKHLPFDFEFRHDRIKVFEQVSRNQNLILKPHFRQPLNDFEHVAGQFLEQIVYIGWPHLIKAKVVKVASRTQCVDEEGTRGNDLKRFDTECKSLQEHFSSRMGIRFPNYDILVYIRTHCGSTIKFGHKGNIYTRDCWSTTLTPYPAQGIVSDLTVKENMRKEFSSVEELFPVGSTIFFIGNPYYGSEGTVVDPCLVYQCGRVQVNICVRPEPNLFEVRQLQEDRDSDYMSSYEVCKMLRVSSKCLGCLTGTVWVVLGPRREKMENVAKHNIGLQLKYPRQNEERIGYCRRLNNQWFYSSVALKLMQEYSCRYPEVISYFNTSNDRGEYVFEQDLFPDHVGHHRVEELANWIRQQPHMKVERVACGSKSVCKETVEALLQALEVSKAMPVKEVKLQVKPHLLIKPNVTLPDAYKSHRAIRLFDRVMVVRTIYMVPTGVKGTVIGIYPVSDPNPVRLECVKAVDTFCEILFDRPVTNCNDIHGIAPEMVYKVPESALIVIYTTNEAEQKGSNMQKMQQHQQQQQSTRSNRNEKPENINSWRRGDGPVIAVAPGADMNGRYISNASTPANPISMHSHVAADFVTPEPSPKAKSVENWRRQPAEAANSGGGGGGGGGNRSRSNRNQAKNQANNQVKEPLPQQQQPQPPQPPTQSKTCSFPKPTNAPNAPNAQTMALKSLLGLGNAAVGSAPAPEQKSPQTQPLLNIPLGMAPGPSQMPKLPQPPLFWQQEAQLQQQKLKQAQAEANFIESKQWQPEQVDEKPSTSKASQMRLQQQQQQQPQQQQQQPQQQQPSQQSFFNHKTQMNPNPNQKQNQNQQQYQNQNQRYFGNQNNNYNNPTQGQCYFSNNNTNNYFANNAGYNGSNNNNQNRNFGTGRTTSIQDFVPTQAFRPKRKPQQQREQNKSSKDIAVAAAEQKANLLTEKNPNQDHGQVDKAAILMKALKIESKEEAPSTSNPAQVKQEESTDAKTEEGNPTKSQAQPRRKPRVPRIGAKFDLEYILH